MPRLEISNVIDILGKDCKNDKHKQCNGNWIGLGFRVECNCVCHNKQYNTSDVKKVRFESTLNISNIHMGKAAKDHFQSNEIDKSRDLRNKNFRADKSFRGSSQHESIAQGED